MELQYHQRVRHIEQREKRWPRLCHAWYSSERLALLPLGERNEADRWCSEVTKLARRASGKTAGGESRGEAGPSLILSATWELTEGTRKLLRLCSSCICWTPCRGHSGCGCLLRLLRLFRPCCCLRCVRKLSACTGGCDSAALCRANASFFRLW